MNTLFEVTGKLNGKTVKAGDVVKAQCGPYVTFTKVTDEDGSFFIFGPGPWGFKVELAHFISQGNHAEIVRPIDVYQFCKRHGWKTEQELIKFK